MTFIDQTNLDIVVAYLSALHERFYTDAEHGRTDIAIKHESQSPDSLREKSDSLLGRALVTAAEKHIVSSTAPNPTYTSIS